MLLVWLRLVRLRLIRKHLIRQRLIRLRLCWLVSLLPLLPLRLCLLSFLCLLHLLVDHARHRWCGHDRDRGSPTKARSGVRVVCATDSAAAGATHSIHDRIVGTQIVYIARRFTLVRVTFVGVAVTQKCQDIKADTGCGPEQPQKRANAVEFA